MHEHIRTMSDTQLRSLISLLVENATSTSIERVDREIDAIGAELMRRQSESGEPAIKQ